LKESIKNALQDYFKVEINIDAITVKLTLQMFERGWVKFTHPSDIRNITLKRATLVGSCRILSEKELTGKEKTLMLAHTAFDAVLL